MTDMPNRRDFIRAGASGMLAIAGMRWPDIAPKPLDILILGGTGFIGPHLVRHAVARGHRITIFTRGRHDADLPDTVIRLQGDRNGQLDVLVGKRWDAVIDDSATNPAWVALSTALLKDAAGAYLFTSSTGVYYPYLTRGLSERDPIHYELEDANDPSEKFGVAKAQCEKQTMTVFGDRGIVVRPTYIVGPGDTTDRFPYWPVRLARGGEVLAPGRADDPMQIIDVRDLAVFMVHLLETGQRGIYNVAGPVQPLTARQFYEQAAHALDAKVTYTFVDDYDFLTAHKIDEAIPWALLKGKDFGMMSIRNDKAIAAGLTIRPLAATLRDTLAWWPSTPQARRDKPHFAISPEQEAEALADWHVRRG
ncbi:MAG TPA: NAD-dependent epimerase/dehydratase family protein [Gemmatimonadaceae bacterium]|nr:NAD-dependent epimerase/dehydratase family protein [Gemmatimonadaceae bacterium]